MSFGTPHDIASMHVASKGTLLPGMEQEHVGGSGRPKESGTWGKHSSPHGRDPLGIKALSGTFNTDKSPLDTKNRKSSPLSVENKQIVNMLRGSSLKTKKIIKESISHNEFVNEDTGTMLDESQLLDD